MRPRARLLNVVSVLTFWSTLGLSPESLQAGVLLGHWTNHFQRHQMLYFEAQASNYSTKQNFSSIGKSFAPNGFNKLERTGADIEVAYGLGDRFTLFGDFSWSYVKTTGTTRPGSSYGFDDQTVGGVFRLTTNDSQNNSMTSPDSTDGTSSSGITVDLQVLGQFPANSNTEADRQNQPYLGDGSVDFAGGLFAGIPLVRSSGLESGRSTILFEPGAAFLSRGSGFSSAIPWSGKVSYRRTDSGLVGSLGVFGYQSLLTDDKKDLLVGEEDISLNVGSSRSYFTNAVNPSLLTVRAEIGLRTQSSTQASHDAGSSWELFFAAEPAILGRSAPKGTTFFVGFRLFDDRGPTDRNSKSLKPENEGAREHTENVDDGDEEREKPELSKANQGFVTYTTEAKVTQVNDRMHLVRIDKGHDAQIAVGQKFDFFSLGAEGSTIEVIARGRVTSITETESALEITEYFKEAYIEEGFTAKRIGAIK